MSNLEAVEVLKNTSSVVSLVIARVKDRNHSIASSEVLGHDLASPVPLSTPGEMMYSE